MRNKLLFVLWILGLVFIIYNWSFGYSGKYLVLSLGRVAALLGTYQILWQLVLIAWGKHTTIHKKNGQIALILILIHGASMFYVYGLSVLQMEDILKAVISLWLFVGVVISSIYIVRNKLKYETWYYVHLLTYLAILLAFGHQLELGGDFGNNLLVAFWYAIYVMTFIVVFYFKFLKLVLNFWKYQFRVEKIIQETPSTVSMYITGTDIKEFLFEPGQYVVIRILDKNYWWQAHPFSFSSLPGQKSLRLTIKSSGDFTSQIKDIKIGTSVILDGPHGEFVSSQTKQDKFLLLAGGVGVTPLRALIEHFANFKKDVVMVYATRNKEEILFAKELAKYKVKYIFGHLEKEILQNLIPDIASREVYICGPESFNKSMKQYSQEFGVKSIHLEEFST